jgi:hypothetical protein
MLHWFRELDRLLRGESTRIPALARGSVEIPLFGLTVVILILGAVYGAGMGTFSLMREGTPEHRQILASMGKVPLLFLATLVVTFPSLYVFNALVGSRLRFLSLLRLMVAALGVTLAVLASLGPIVAFFSLSTKSYPFMVLLNVAFFAVAGALGLAFLLQTLHRLSLIDEQSAVPAGVAVEPIFEEPAASAPSPPPLPPLSAIDRLPGHLLGHHVKTVFRLWILVYGAVGAQMGWILRPFVGDPNRDFTWFRERESNFFEAVVQTVRSLFP